MGKKPSKRIEEIRDQIIEDLFGDRINADMMAEETRNQFEIQAIKQYLDEEENNK